MSHLSSQSVLILGSYSALTETENQQVLRELHSTRHPRSFLNCHGNSYKFFFSERTQHKACTSYHRVFYFLLINIPIEKKVEK